MLRNNRTHCMVVIRGNSSRDFARDHKSYIDCLIASYHRHHSSIVVYHDGLTQCSDTDAKSHQNCPHRFHNVKLNTAQIGFHDMVRHHNAKD